MSMTSVERHVVNYDFTYEKDSKYAYSFAQILAQAQVKLESLTKVVNLAQTAIISTDREGVDRTFVAEISTQPVAEAKAALINVGFIVMPKTNLVFGVKQNSVQNAPRSLLVESSKIPAA